MSKMGQELDKRLEENKYEMWEVLKYIRQQILLGHYAGNNHECAHCKLEKVLAKIDGDK